MHLDKNQRELDMNVQQNRAQLTYLQHQSLFQKHRR
jgi:hypothetical protein